MYLICSTCSRSDIPKRHEQLLRPHDLSMSFPLTAFFVLITAFGDVPPMLGVRICLPTTFVDWRMVDVDLSSGCFLLFLSLLMVTMMLIGYLPSLEVPWMCWWSWLRRV